MNTTQDDGGPAFPRFVPDGHYNGSVDFTGMSLRDWFAGMALAGLPIPPTGDLAPVEFARSAYAIADAMLAARKEGK